MNKFRMTENWRLTTILVPAVIVLYVLFNFLVLPKFESWIMAQIPGSTAVKNALTEQFPQDNVAISSNTNYGSGSKSKQRTLTISEVGSKSLTPDQLAKAKDVVCAALGQYAKQYNSIYIQNKVEHRILFFYTAHSEGQNISCQ